MRPIVSIITLTYNHEKYIAECIESVLRQMYEDWEMIIIDDGSTDNTPSIIRQYSDQRITYIYKEHKGIEFLGENYNHALEISKGDFILILEGDDYIPVNRLELQLSSFEDEDVVLSHGKYAYVFDDKMVVYPTIFKGDILKNKPVGALLKVFLYGFNPIGTQSVMVRKSALLEIGGFTQPSYLPLVDYPTWIKLAFKGRFDYINKVLGYWRRHPLSVTIIEGEKMFHGFLRHCDEIAASFTEELSKLGLTKYMKNRGAVAYLAIGLIELTKKDYKGALEHIEESWSRKEVLNWAFKIRVVISLISVYLHLDIPNYLLKIRELFYRK